MSAEKSYVNARGDTVFTSAFLKAKSSCCQSVCLHCPYGYTLKKKGLSFTDWDASRVVEAQEILQEAGHPEFDLSSFVPDNLKFITIKDETCGLMVKNHIVIKALFLRKHFQNQGLNREIVESYFFI